MKFGIFYEHQLPRPWAEGDEHTLFQQALDQIELADRLGIDYLWEVEHHFLDEYSHASAPEVFLGAAAGLFALSACNNTQREQAAEAAAEFSQKYDKPILCATELAVADRQRYAVNGFERAE